MKESLVKTVLMILISISVLLFSGNIAFTENSIIFPKLKLKLSDPRGKPVKYAEVDYKVFYNNSNIYAGTEYSNKNGELFIRYRNGETLYPEKMEVKISSDIYLDRKFEFSKNKIDGYLNGKAFYAVTLHPDPEICNVNWNSRKHLSLYVRPVDRKNLSVFLKKDKLKKAEEYIKKKIPPDRRKHAYIFMGFISFESSNYKRAKEYFGKGDSLLWYNLMGIKHFKSGDFVRALDYLLKGTLRSSRTDMLFKMAEIFEKQGNREYAIKSYSRCLKDYSKLMEGLNYKWRDVFIYRSVVCVNKLKRKYRFSDREEKTDNDREAILEKAGKYCEKIKDSALYFYNIAEKKEYIKYSKKTENAMMRPYVFFKEYSPLRKISYSGFINRYKYDYQLIINPDGSISENRTPISQRLNMESNKDISNYYINKAFYGPVNLIGKEWQSAYNYRILKYSKLFERYTVVLEAKPVISPTFNRLSGKIWIDVNNGSVLKIQWIPYGLKSRKEIRKRSVILNRIPELIFVSEFAKVRGNLRFPSRSYIVETYKSKKGESFTRIKTVYEYKDYRFFQVDTESTIKDDEIL